MTSPDSLPRSLGGNELVERVGDSGTVHPLPRHPPALQRDATFVERFRDEVHLASLLTSPNIVRVLEQFYADLLGRRTRLC